MSAFGNLSGSGTEPTMRGFLDTLQREISDLRAEGRVAAAKGLTECAEMVRAGRKSDRKAREFSKSADAYKPTNMYDYNPRDLALNSVRQLYKRCARLVDPAKK